MLEFKTGSVRANELQFHYLELGEGPLALCLHGFPDSPWTYRFLLPELASAGYRAVAPFMRGYAPTDVPADGSYKTSALAADVAALHEALHGDVDAVLIAHDWGSVAAYGGAALTPGRWRRCVIMNVPPLRVFGQLVFRYDQIKRSFYFWFFQMQISDTVVPTNDLAFIDGLWADWSPGYDATEDLPRVNLSVGMEQQAVWGRPIPQPTLYLHGTQDGCIALDAEAAKGVLAFLGQGSKVERIDEVGHFMLVERPAEINGRILQFLIEKRR